MREFALELGVLANNPHSCMIRIGNTHVICSATVEETLPPFLRNKNKGGWLTAEYGMLPRCSADRIKRESMQGKVSGRTQEIQRLIGRSLRSIMDMKLLGERQITIDCDVINADGGTRTASITGAYVALHLAIRWLMDRKLIRSNPLKAQIAAISCGVYEGAAVLDLDYAEDSVAEIDGNFVFTSDGGIVEVQTSAEGMPCSEESFNEMFAMAKASMAKLFAHQNKVLLNL